MSCAPYSEERQKCQAVYGKSGEDCLAQALQEKRCLSICHCPAEAKRYYGSSLTVEGLPKGLCSSWAEAFAFAGKELHYSQEFVEHHEKAQNYINQQNPHLKNECRRIARDLAKCLKMAL